MALAECRKILRTLLREVAREKPYDRFEEDIPGTFRKYLAPGPIRTASDLEARYLRLSPVTTNHYWDCVGCLEAEQECGDLEHYFTFQVRDALWEAVSEAWLLRREGNPSIERIIDSFIANNRAPFGEWTVLWEIDWLTVEESLPVGDVTLFVLGLANLESLGLSRANFFGDHYRRLVGQTFARVVVRAGTRENAVSRARPIIDDSLDLLRAGLSRNMWIVKDQVRFRRGQWLFAHRVDDPQGVVATHAFEERPVEIEAVGIIRDQLDLCMGRWRELLTANAVTKLSGQVHLALTLVGRSTVQSNPDLALLDLCMAMESVLSGVGDRRKGEALVVRSLLLGIYVDDATYELEPLNLYEAYRTRNKLIHGSAARQFSAQDVDPLRYAVDEMIDRVIQVAARDSTIRTPESLFNALERPEYVARARRMIYRFERTAPRFVRSVQGYLDGDDLRQ